MAGRGDGTKIERVVDSPSDSFAMPATIASFRTWRHLRLVCVTLAPIPLLAVRHLQGQSAPAPLYMNAQAHVERRVADLLGRMTLEGKVAQMLSMWQLKAAITDSAGRFNPSAAPSWFRIGIGRIERPSDKHGARAEAEYTNAIQRWVRDSTRLGIPIFFHEEALHGLQGPEATSFPQAIALASSWNPALVERIMATVAAEVRARGAQQVLAPVVDIARDPRWGASRRPTARMPISPRDSASPPCAASRGVTRPFRRRTSSRRSST